MSRRFKLDSGAYTQLAVFFIAFSICGSSYAQDVVPPAEAGVAPSEHIQAERGTPVAPSIEAPDLAELEARVLSALEEGKSPKLPFERMWSMARQDEATATNFLAAMERLAPEFSDPEMAWDAQLYMAETAMYLRDHERADQIYGGLLAQDPGLETEAGRSAHYAHAQTLLGRGEHERAITQLRALWDVSARHSPEEFQTFGRQLAMAYVMAKDWENMAEVSGSLMGRLEDFDDVMFVFGIAEGYRKAEHYGPAIEIYQRLYNYLSKLEVEDPTNRIFEFEQYSRSRIKFRLDWAKSSAEGKKHTDAALIAEEAKADNSEAAKVTAELASNTFPLASATPEATMPTQSTAPEENPSRWTDSPTFWVGIGAVILVAVGAGLRAFR